MPSVARPSAPGRSIGPIEPELNQTPLSQHLCCRPEVTFLVNITLGWGLLMKAEDGEKGEGRKDTWSLAGLHSHTGPDLPGAPWDSTLWGSGPPPLTASSPVRAWGCRAREVRAALDSPLWS